MNMTFVKTRILRILEIVMCAIVFGSYSLGVVAYADEPQMKGVDRIATEAEAAWMEGATIPALDILDEAIRDHPNVLRLQKLRGDVLATARRDQEAIEAYDAILQKSPKAIHVRWAKWSVLHRSGQGDRAISELQRIAELDIKNPLVPLQMAQDLRKLDRLEESLEWYEKAVAQTPGFPGWRLAMARARFDILDGRGARDEVKHILTMVSPGSPEEVAARSLLSVVYGATKERGRRYQPIFSPEGTAAERKEWASIRAEAWKLFESERYQEAEPLLRKVLALKPSDHTATHDLGVTLMELGRHEEALPVLEKVLTITTKDLVLADSFFRIGQSLAALKRWSEALDHFQILYDAAIEFEESTKDVPVKADIQVLDKEKLETWINKVRPHVANATSPMIDSANERIPPIDPTSPAALSVEDAYEKAARKKLKPEDPLFRRASLMGRDADFSTFRFVIPAERVLRDDLPGGAHDFIPIDPGNTFANTQEEIFLVFGLVTASFDEVPLTAECFHETAKITRDQVALAEDRVIMAMNEQTGYFVLTKPESDWPTGLYRCGLFIGEEVSAYTHADEVRFRIIDPTPSS